ncbi:hypothetical protein L195_g016447 [Trifolium pratense]|uniref:Uncharacterized protein n=1 Tax=Trifolium pratense TaxID=57577 RepID=A0A2K3MRA2_TRIPR|nr:hypothetical protein L195_g016447 [Trifolium pratense]
MKTAEVANAIDEKLTSLVSFNSLSFLMNLCISCFYDANWAAEFNCLPRIKVNHGGLEKRSAIQSGLECWWCFRCWLLEGNQLLYSFTRVPYIGKDTIACNTSNTDFRPSRQAQGLAAGAHKLAQAQSNTYTINIHA